MPLLSAVSWRLDHNCRFPCAQGTTLMASSSCLTSRSCRTWRQVAGCCKLCPGCHAMQRRDSSMIAAAGLAASLYASCWRQPASAAASDWPRLPWPPLAAEFLEKSEEEQLNYHRLGLELQLKQFYMALRLVAGLGRVSQQGCQVQYVPCAAAPPCTGVPAAPGLVAWAGAWRAGQPVF